MENNWMLQLLGVPRSTVIEWSITMAETSIEFARIYEPGKVRAYEADLRYLKTELAKEQFTVQTNPQ